ncbi:MAG: ATP synthase F0 subunit B [Acidobacteriota bacterium]|nr:ATP synthase F0 subunit B [Acidobacteriota bacterium]
MYVWSERERCKLVFLAFAESQIQLVPDGTLVFHLAVIVVMVALLNVTLLKPINRILEERERRTKGRLSEAQQALATVDQKLREYERRLREARTEGYALMEQERILLSREREGKVAEVKSEITSWLSGEKENLRSEAEKVKANLEADAHTRALEISQRILHR